MRLCRSIPALSIVVSKWALQVAENLNPIFDEVARILKPGGSFIFLATHPTRQWMEQKRPGKDYFNKEVVESVLFGGSLKVYESTHTLSEFLSRILQEL